MREVAALVQHAHHNHGLCVQTVENYVQTHFVTPVTVLPLTNPWPRGSFLPHVEQVLGNLRLGAPPFPGPTGRLGLTLHRAWRPGALFVIVTDVYIDEADTHEGTEAIYMAAVAQKQAGWERFDRRWRKLERQKRLSYSHACEIRGKWGRHGEYEHWTEVDVAQFVRRADLILEEDSMFTFVVRMEREVYETCYKNVKRPSRKYRPDTDYALCFRSVLSFVPEYIAMGLRTRDIEVNFILEEHERFGDAHRVFLEIKNDIPEIGQLLGTCVPGAKKRFPGLRGADWQAYKVAFHNPKPTPETPPTLPPIDPHNPPDLPEFGRRAFARMKREENMPPKLPEKAPIFIAHADETMMQQLLYGTHGWAALKHARFLERRREYEAKKTFSSGTGEE